MPDRNSATGNKLAARIAAIAGTVTVLAAGAALAGWLLDIPALHTLGRDQVSMKANTAAGFTLSGLLLLVGSMRPAVLRSVLRFALLTPLVLLALLTLAQNIWNVNLGIDEIIVAAPSDWVLTSSPGRMAPTTAICFILFALAVTIDHWQSTVARAWSRIFATILMLTTVASLLGYAYGAPQLYLGIEGSTAMSLQSAILFLLLGVGAIWMRHDSGFPAMLIEESAAGTHLRALLVMVVGTPLLTGAAVAAGYGRFYDGPFAIALAALSSVVAAGLVAIVSIIMQKRGQDTLSVRDRAIAAATNGVIITDHRDSDQKISFVNTAFTEITGYSRDECIGKNCRFLNYAGENPPEVMQALRDCIRNAEIGTFELVNRRKDRSIFWNRLGLAPVVNNDGTVTHYVGIIDEFTDKKMQEEQLENALAEARSANSMRNTFVRLISHELRTPLNSALTWVRLMEMDDSIETRVKGMQVVANSIESQSRLVDDLVDVTRFASTGVQLESVAVNFAEQVRMAVEELRPVIEEDKELDFKVQAHDYSAVVDPLRVQQITRNLVTNAHKYTPSGGHIAVELRADGRDIVLSVSDSGKGLLPEEIAQVFEPFWRATSHQPGLGVGLSIVASLVKAHDGRIEVSSNGPGKGSSFVVRIPRDSAPEHRTALN